MNKLWSAQAYSSQKLCRTIDKKGLYTHVHPHIHPFIRREILLFTKWLRACFEFPIRVHVHIFNAKRILSRSNELCYGICFIPDDPNEDVSVYIAGGYKDDGDLQNLRNFTWTTIGTLAHELGHYYQYINLVSLTDRGREWQATYYAHKILSEYYDAGCDRFSENW